MIESTPPNSHESHSAATDFRSEHVTLRGGPCDGLRVPATVNSPWKFSRPLLMEDADNPEVVARYRPSREKGVYTFRGMERVIARIPLPGDDRG
jgi:hypothetical protein